MTAAPPEPVPGAELRSAFDNAPIGMAVLTPEGVVTACNAALGELLGRRPDEMLGRTMFEVTHADDLPAARYKCTLLRSGGTRIVRHDCRLLRTDDSVVWASMSTSRVPGSDGRPAHLIMHVEDITDRKVLEAELSHQALHDPLTGLANRTLLMREMRCGLPRAGHTRAYWLFYVDLDGFKEVNDRLGHPAGDVVLQQLAARITALLRPGDVAARLGGDEFAVLCVGLDPRQADALAQRLRAAAAEPFLVDGVTVRLTAAVGSSTTAGTGQPGVGPAELDPADLLRRADLHMYEDKRRRPSAS